MKITVFIGSLLGGGAERVACNIANYFSDQGYAVDALVMSENSSIEILNNSIRIIPLLKAHERKNFVSNTIKRYNGFKKYVSESGTDCFIVLLPATILLALSQRKRIKVPIIISERSDPKNYGTFCKMLLNLFADRADYIVCQTPEIASWYKRFCKKDKVVVIPNAINKAFTSILPSSSKENKIVAVGRLIKEKNYKLLIDAFSRVKKNNEKYCLEIYGTGYLEQELKQYVERLDLSSAVHFMGHSNKINEDIRNASLFVMSSDIEGMPNALMEAMAMGIPCVATDCSGGGASFLIQNNINGELVPRGNVEALSSAMIKVLSDRDYADSIARNALEIRSVLAPEKVYAEWEALVSRALDNV